MQLIDAKILMQKTILNPFHPPYITKRDVESMPTVDAVPVVHGRWEGDETCDAYDIAGVKTWAVKRKCSECGFTHKFIEAHMCYVFCPNCGARMDGD